VNIHHKSVGSYLFGCFFLQVQTMDDDELLKPVEEVDTISLQEFLDRVVPMLEEAMDLNVEHHESFGGLRKEEADGSAMYAEQRLVAVLSLPEDAKSVEHLASEAGEDTIRPPLEVSDVDWNCTGNIIGVGWGRIEESGWSSESGCVAVWNIHHRLFDPKKPENMLETVSYVVSLAFHPKKPSLLAVGLFHGEVLLWDISQEESGILATTSSNVDSYAHREPVWSMQWVFARAFDEYMLSTASSEGKVLVWSLKSGFTVPVMAVHQGTKSFSMLRGVSSIAFLRSNHLENSIVIGKETGGLTISNLMDISSKIRAGIGSDQTSIEMGVDEVGRGDDDESKPSLHGLALEGHSGPIHSISASPFHRNAFLTCSMDGTIHIYNVLQQHERLRVTVPRGAGSLLDAQWCPHRPLVMLGAAANGTCYVWDMVVSSLAPVMELHSESSCQTVSCNPSQPEYIATGHRNGNARIWFVGSAFSSSSVHPNEMSMLNRMMDFEGDQ
jgi:WD repeat-containing protein 34